MYPSLRPTGAYPLGIAMSWNCEKYFVSYGCIYDILLGQLQMKQKILLLKVKPIAYPINLLIYRSKYLLWIS